MRKLGGALLGAILCTGAALATWGCGAANVVDPVAQAATSSTSAPGYRMIFSSQFSSPALPFPVTSTGRGSFDAVAEGHPHAAHQVQGQALNMVMAIDFPTYGPQPAPVFPPAEQVTDLNALLSSAGQSGKSPSS